MRFAVYAVPPAESALYRAGVSVLGTDAETGAPVAFPDDPAFQTDRWADLTANPRRYGFHATLKAPFEPAPGVGEADVVAAVAGLAATLAPVEIGALAITHRYGYLALRPQATDQSAIDRLAWACVTELDPLRAPLSDHDRARHLAKALTPAQRTALERWGYPYVGADFALHLTLSDDVAAEEAARWTTVLARTCPALSGPWALDALTVCRQPDRTAPFRIVARLPLGRR